MFPYLGLSHVHIRQPPTSVTVVCFYRPTTYTSHCCLFVCLFVCFYRPTTYISHCCLFVCFYRPTTYISHCYLFVCLFVSIGQPHTSVTVVCFYRPSTYISYCCLFLCLFVSIGPGAWNKIGHLWTCTEKLNYRVFNIYQYSSGACLLFCLFVINFLSF